MITSAHTNSKLQMRAIIPVDSAHTRFMAHYDMSANDIYGIKPYDSYIEDNTVLCYTADSLMKKDTSTYVLDKSMWGNYGKIYGSVTTQGGLNGKALLFDGATGYIECLSNDRLKGIRNLVSVEAWVYYTAYGGSTTYSVLAVKGTPWTFLMENPSNRFRFRATINGVDTTATDPAVHNLNEWYYLVGTYDGQALRMYKNGELVAETTCPGKLAVNDQPVRIGNWSSSYHLTGKIDRVAVYDRALSTDEIKRRYKRSIYSVYPDGKYDKCIAIESATENLIINPSSFSNATWTRESFSGTITEDAACAPDGTLTADQINTTGCAGVYRRMTLSPLTTYTFSCYYKSATGADISGGMGIWCYNGTGSAMRAKTNFTITSEWQRFSVTYTALAGETDFSFTVVGNWLNQTVCNVYVWGAQLEESKFFPTSFINGTRSRGSLVYDNPISGCMQFTISFWAKITAVNTNDTNTILSINDYGSQPQEVVIDVLGGSLRMFTINDDSGGASIFGPSCPSPNEWTHYAFVREANKNIMYINGVKEGEVAATMYSMSGGTMKLGDRSAAVPRYIEGLLIDELRIDDVPRTEDEILKWYLNDTPFYPRGFERMV